MEIPLKSRPEVSTTHLLQELPFVPKLHENDSNNTIIGDRDTVDDHEPRRARFDRSNGLSDTLPHKNYKLTRTYSETEANNFDLETGHRLFDDGKIRPKLLRTNSPAKRPHNSPTPPPSRIYSRSHNEYVDDDTTGLVGLEDEYIPGLNFGDMVYKWNLATNSDQNLAGGFYKESLTADSTLTSHSSTPHSRNQSYLDLNKLHAQVAPQPIKFRNLGAANPKFLFTRLNDYMKQRQSPSVGPKNDTSTENYMAGTNTLTRKSENDGFERNKKLKSGQLINPDTGDINYELILNSLPSNFNDLPYSQRKKMVKSFSESIDYSQFSLFAKSYLSDKGSSGSNKTPRSGSVGNSGYLRRSRRNSSTNTVAGRLLALSSSTDLRKFHDSKPKENVDEKGALVMGYVLGKVIGFGAWGTIRECYGDDGVVRAVKIVKSQQERDHSSPRKSSSFISKEEIHSNVPKVLEVFKKEISIWQQLHHENILPLIKHLETENATFCITNRILGGTLFEMVSNWGVYDIGLQTTQPLLEFLLENVGLRVSQTSNFIKQIVNALIYMHQELGIVHGDLKLENVLVDDQDKNDIKMILCDFGMSRVYTTRLSRQSSRVMTKHLDSNDSASMMRSKSSNTDLRRPYTGGHTPSTRYLFTDDSKIGISNILKAHGPSMQSLDLTPTQSRNSLFNFHENKIKDHQLSSGIESDLPHSHIGSLPYASPELLLPSPPPLGPSADIWALGVLMYTMIVGKLPFQHPYEPRLRAMISAGKYAKDDLQKALLMQWVLANKDAGISEEEGKEECRLSGSLLSHSFVDMKRLRHIDQIHKTWQDSDHSQYKWLYDLITGCLEVNITKRYDLDMIYDSLKEN